jgi:hypothetical protein
LVTHSEFDPKSEATEKILTELGCDPLYIKLCKTQECFRARLTPKFWRCRSLSAPPNRFPWETPEDERKFREWEKTYDNERRKYSTCRFVAAIGNASPIAEARLIIQEHDRIACSGNSELLA